MSRTLTSTGGFTYIAALVMVMILGILSGLTGQSMRIILQREKEKELIFRGLQYRDAIERWYTKQGVAISPLREIKSLLKDPRTQKGEPLIRQLYTDPITGKDFKVIEDPNLGITGVQSASEAPPMKVANFPDVIKEFEKKEKYSDWKFEYKRTVAAPGAPAGTAPGAAGATTRSFPLSTPEGP